MIALFWQLAYAFFIIGTFTFGGGYAMLSLIQTKVVFDHCWITESQFTDIIAISQMTPGPIGINTATYVGYEVLINAGASQFVAVLGSATATLALVLPSFIIVLALVKLYLKYSRSSLFEGVMSGVRPAVVGLIGAAAVVLTVNISWNGFTPDFSIVHDTFIDWKSWVLFGGAMIASLVYKINPIILIVVGGIMGLILY